MTDLKQYLKSSAIHLNAREILQSPIAILLGVSQDAADRLKPLQINTVFDLATAQIFAAAANIAGSTITNTLFSRYGAVSADIIDDSLLDREVSELALQPIAALDGIDTITGPQIATTLQVQTIRDLAFWPPYVAAVTIVQQVLLPENTPGFDPEAPADLIPTSGDYPTEKVFYSSVVIDEIKDQASQDLTGPVDITVHPAGFTTPAIGAIITIEQCWYLEGVALGNLLHSLALAPGESTRIATIDWFRQTQGQRLDAITQSESLSNATRHNRAISEVTQAVADESQSGSSQVDSSSRSRSFGASGGGRFGAFSFGASASFASNRNRVKAVSSSYGRRDLMASMTQNVNDQTQQQANAVRNRRASVVTEVSQQEQETLATRTVTNYNHMHALSIQYYEVLQIYRTTCRVSQVEKCLFVPMQMIADWRQRAMLVRYRNILHEVALDPKVRSALGTLSGTIKLSPGIQQLHHQKDANTLISAELFPRDAQLVGLKLSFDQTSLDGEVLQWTAGWRLKLKDGETLTGTINAASSDEMPAPINLAAIEAISCRVALQNHEVDERPIKLELQIFDGGETLHRNLIFSYKILDSQGGGSSSLGGFADVVLATEEGQNNERFDWLVGHLAENNLYYNQMIWLKMDSATRTLILASYRYEGAPLVQQIDPDPITVMGNYLVFRMNVDAADPDWQAWLDDRGYNANTMRHETVPLPSGGVFAEAVLGRFNSAEKLDMSRFWNWQDSPIPFAAPEIAALQAGQHTVEGAPTTGTLDQPIVNIVNPTSLPDPQGMTGILNTLGNGNLFRDMSGREQAFVLAQEGLKSTSQTAIAAGKQAGLNMTEAGALLNRAAEIDAKKSNGSNEASSENGGSDSAPSETGDQGDSNGAPSGTDDNGESDGVLPATDSTEENTFLTLTGQNPIAAKLVASVGNLLSSQGESERLASQVQWLKQTGDGWVLTKDARDNLRALPSSLKIEFMSQMDGRERFKVLEGIYHGSEGSIVSNSGLIAQTNPNGEAADIVFEDRADGPVTLEGRVYDKQIKISYSDGSTIYSVGPFPALTDANNPVPIGTNTVQIPDFPHDLGAGYGSYGTVWFRIGTSGDRYIHPGRVSAGCITCYSGNWQEIYNALIFRRKNDGISVGNLTVR